MKITILSLWAHKLFRPDDPQPFGGAELQLFLLANEWAGYPEVQVQFITRGHGGYEQYEYGGIQVFKLPYRSSNLTRSTVGVVDCLRLCLKLTTDCFIQRGGGIETGIAGFASRRRRVPLLFMTSSTWDVDGTHVNRRGLLYGNAYRYGLNCATAIVTQTQHQSNVLKQRFQRDSIVLGSAHTIPETIPDNKEGILWVGRCEPCKDPALFLRLVELCPDLSFTMVCPPANSRSMYESIKLKAESLPNLAFYPGVSYQDTEALFARHAIMANTSHQEGYPNTYVQSLKWGAPIVTYAFDPDNIVSTHRLGYNANRDFVRFSTLTRSLSQDRNTWTEFSANARKYAFEHHDIRAIANRLLAIIGELANEKNIPAQLREKKNLFDKFTRV